MTVEDILYTAYRFAGILNMGQTMSPEMIQDGLRTANSFLDGLKTERLMVFAIDRREYSLNPANLQRDSMSGAAYYRIGPGGEIQDIGRPVRIERAGLVMLSSSPHPEIPLRVCETEQQWAEVWTKGLSSTYPQTVWYQRLQPQGKLWFYPVPEIVSNIALYPWVTLQKFGNSTDVLDFPEGYQEFVEYNLAVRIAALNPKVAQISAAVVELARTTKARLMGQNTPDYLMRTELGALSVGDRPSGVGRWNMYTNTRN